MLYPAMQYGEDIHIEGVVSSKLLFNLNNYVIPLIKSFSPSSKSIKVTASKVSTKNYQGEGVGTGFSGGVDSFCTIYDHYELEEDPNYKINSFLFLNVGSHGSKNKEKVEKTFKTRFNYLKEFPLEIGVDFIPVDSNLYMFHPWGHQKTHTLTSASGILFMQNLFKRYYYASAGLNYGEMLATADKYKEHDIGAYCEPILLPLLATESMEIIADGTQYNRIEKTIRIADYKPAQRYLNVCIIGGDTYKNCSVCSKCRRTLMTLNSIGKLEDFSKVFDIKKYKSKAEKRYVAKQLVFQDEDLFAKKNVELAKKNNIKLTKGFYYYLYFILRLIKPN